MTKDDITTMRTELANKFAEAGAAFLDFTGTGSALAAIPDTDPQQYAAAGTLETIRRIWPQDEAAATVLTDERIDEIAKAHSTTLRGWEWSGDIIEVNGYLEYEFARDIEREVLAHAGKAVAAEAQAEIDRLRSAAPTIPAQVPAVVREAIEATFEQRPGYLTKVAAAVRALDTSRAAQVPAAEVRAAALEQAAQACEAQNDTDWPTPLGCAKAIRALKGQSTADKASEVRAEEKGGA